MEAGLMKVFVKWKLDWQSNSWLRIGWQYVNLIQCVFPM